MNTLLLASTEESTGKTAVALALGQLAKEGDRAVGYMKPKGTRLQSQVGKTLDADPMLARELLDLDAEVHEMEPIVYSPTFIEGAIRGQENPDELRDRIVGAFEGIAEDNDLVIVEGSGHYTTGNIVDLGDDVLADLFDAKVVLLERIESVTDIDRILGAVDQFGERCEGIIFNAVTDSMYDLVESDIVPFLKGQGISVYGVVPRDRELAGVTLSDLTDELGGEILTSAEEDVFVERVLVGAMSGESALSYFRRTKDAAVITGGDRADIQRAALEAPGVKALILTGGFEPVGAVLGKAAQRNVPVLKVQSDTLATVERAEELIRGGRVRDARTVEQMRTLLHDHVDIDSVLE